MFCMCNNAAYTRDLGLSFLPIWSQALVHTVSHNSPAFKLIMTELRQLSMAHHLLTQGSPDGCLNQLAGFCLHRSKTSQNVKGLPDLY
jgi:hypothetical protein